MSLSTSPQPEKRELLAFERTAVRQGRWVGTAQDVPRRSAYQEDDPVLERSVDRIQTSLAQRSERQHHASAEVRAEKRSCVFLNPVEGCTLLRSA